jgi:hypothetical protein
MYLEFHRQDYDGAVLLPDGGFECPNDATGGLRVGGATVLVTFIRRKLRDQYATLHLHPR